MTMQNRHYLSMNVLLPEFATHYHGERLRSASCIRKQVFCSFHNEITAIQFKECIVIHCDYTAALCYIRWLA